MEELASWPIIIGALFALIALGMGALAVPNHPDRVTAAKAFFIFAALVWGGKIVMWGYSTEKGAFVRFSVCFIFFGFIGWGLMEGIRFASRALTPTADSLVTAPAEGEQLIKQQGEDPKLINKQLEITQVPPLKPLRRNSQKRSSLPDDGEDILLGRKKGPEVR